MPSHPEWTVEVVRVFYGHAVVKLHSALQVPGSPPAREQASKQAWHVVELLGEIRLVDCPELDFLATGGVCSGSFIRILLFLVIPRQDDAESCSANFVAHSETSRYPKDKCPNHELGLPQLE